MPCNQRFLPFAFLYRTPFLERKLSSKHLSSHYLCSNRAARTYHIIIIIKFVTSSVLLFSQHFQPLGDWKKTVSLRVSSFNNALTMSDNRRRRGRKDVRRAHHLQHAQRTIVTSAPSIGRRFVVPIKKKKKGRLRGRGRQSRRLFGRVHVCVCISIYIYIYIVSHVL